MSIIRTATIFVNKIFNLLNKIYKKFVKQNYLTNANVSLAIASSSLVGITQSLTFESAVEIMPSTPQAFSEAASSSLTPRNPRYFQTIGLNHAAFSPTPAVNVIASTPFIAAV